MLETSQCESSPKKSSLNLSSKLYWYLENVFLKLETISEGPGEAAASHLTHHHYEFIINSSALAIRESRSKFHFLQDTAEIKTAKSLKHGGSCSSFL